MLIVIEGPDLAGKTTLANRIREVTGAEIMSGEPGKGIGRNDVRNVKPYFTRAVLLDVERYANGGVPMEPGQAVTEAMLVATLAAEGLHADCPSALSPNCIRPGDVVLVHTGYGHARWGLGTFGYYLNDIPGIGVTFGAAGIDLGAAIFLAERGAAAVGADAPFVEVQPNFEIAHLGVIFPVHNHLLVKNGIPLIESMDLTAAAAFAAPRYGSLPPALRPIFNPYVAAFSMDPLPIVGGTGSPVAPKVIF